MDRPNILMEPTKKEWAALYQAAIEFKAIAPWQWMADDDLFAVENPSDGEVGYCSVLGKAGEEFGLVVFVGPEGYRSYLQMITSEVGPESFFDIWVNGRSLSVTFSDRDEIQKEDRDIIRLLELRFRGRKAWPLFRSQRPGYVPWYLDQGEVLFLTAALGQSLVVASRVANEGLDLFRGVDADLILTRYYYEAQWLEEWCRPKLPSRQPVVSPALDEGQLDQLRLMADRLRGSWELDFFHVPAATDSGSGRPYYPCCILAVERRHGLIIGADLMGPSPSDEEKQNAIIGMLERGKQLPAEIRVGSPEVKGVVEPVTEALGIRLILGPLTALQQAKRSLSDYLC
ncbi:hypothetical protein M1O54_06785 [Dehalococcoidia bacterium]|nr:hypothetical protein [Dehalococcoidia bacterium]MCL0073933.1 hypothetical protein [Dehalococcoidia bacterium]MCL0090036.1 hypothetical protein [Dehalococcoidia bacterium]